MIRTFILLSLIISLYSCDSTPGKNSLNLQNLNYGLNFSDDNIIIKVPAIDAESVKINIYHDCDSKNILESLGLKKTFDFWYISLDQSYKNKIFDFTISRNDSVYPNVVDPYVKATCANGNKGALINPSEINPGSWSTDSRIKRDNSNPIILYEIHVRDYSINKDSDFKYPGKYLAFTEDKPGIGLEHIRNMGVTHLHLLPVFDFASIDELSSLEKYNWGYDPQNYFVAEGSFSTQANIPANRIIEFKKMVQSIHNQGLGVIMDVVYNHTYYLDNSSFQVWDPGGYYRQWNDGNYSNASACGNEIATEKEHVQKMILSSLEYWMQEYHIDGFRFDLMGIMDVNTMKRIEERLMAIDSSVVLYGEGWLAGDSPLPDSLRAVKANISKMDNIAVFSDEIRDGIKGHWSDEKDKGFVTGKTGMKNSVKFGIVGGVEHPQIDYHKVNNSNFAWADHPKQCISYVSCHDNHTLWDKLEISAPELSEETRKKCHLLAQTIVLTSQATAFLHAGTEFFRTKFGEHNSFESPDSINEIHWHQIENFQSEISYIRDLIQFKKENDLLNMNKNDIQKNIEFLDNDDNYIMFRIRSETENDLILIFNPVNNSSEIELPQGEWKVLFSGFKKAKSGQQSVEKIELDGPDAWILSLI